MKLPFVITRPEVVRDLRGDVRNLSTQLHDATVMVQQAQAESAGRGRDLSRMGPQLAQLQERLNQSASLVAAKQNELAMLRAELDRTIKALEVEREGAANERHKLMDWIAKGVSNGVPIFAEIPLPAAETEAPAPAPGSERVPTDVEAAIARVGRRPRSIVNHISKVNEVNFEAAMAGAGVKRVFQEDRVVAEAEAEAINEIKTA